MAETLTELVTKITTDASGLKRGLTNAEKAAEKTSKSIQKSFKNIGTSMTNIGKELSMKLTAPIVGIGGAAFKMAGDFDQSFRRVNVMLGVSSEEAENYKKRILEISSATGKTATEVTDAFYQIVSAGYRGADSLDILETAMRGAVGGAAQTESATAALTKAMNIFQLEGVEGSSKAMDVFFGIVDTGLLSFEQMAKAFPRAATNAAGLGISIEETGAALGTLSKVMGSTEQAGTAVDAMLRMLISPSEAMNDLFAEWGVKSGPEAIESFGGLTGVLEELRKTTNGEVVAIRELFASDEAMRGALPLLTSSYEDYNNAIETVTNSQGKTNEAFEEMATGPGFTLTQSITKLKNTAIKLGSALSELVSPALETLTEWVEKAIGWFQSLDPQTQKIIMIMVGLFAAIGPLVFILGQLAVGISFLMGPIGLVIAAIVAFIAIGILLWKNWDTIKAKAIEIWTAISDFFKGTWDNIKGFFRNAGEFVTNVWNNVINFFKGIPRRISQAFSTVKDIILSPFRAAWRGIEMGLNWLIGMFNRISFDIPDWVPGIGGKHFGINIPKVSLPSFATGGVVPGPEGQPQLAIVHGGETIIPNHEPGNVNINFTQPVFFDQW